METKTLLSPTPRFHAIPRPRCGRCLDQPPPESHTNLLQPETQLGLSPWCSICAHGGKAITDVTPVVVSHDQDGPRLQILHLNFDLMPIRRAPCSTPHSEFLTDLITSAHRLLPSGGPTVRPSSIPL